MRRDDALLAGANLAVAAFLVMAGPSMAIAAADPGASHGNGGKGKSGNSQGGSSRGNPGNGSSGNGSSGNGGSTTRGNPGGTSSASGQTNTAGSSNGKGGGNGNGNGANNAASGARSNHGSDSPVAAPAPTRPNQPMSVVVAEQHTGTTAGRSWWAVPAVTPLAAEARTPAAPRDDGAADLLSADHTGVPVWAAAEPVGLRGDLFGLAGLVLMPLVGLAVGYRQAKAARDADLTIGP
ncbi:hypothetical protein [Mycolicibacterium aubagnense]|uniref:Uncharacterized protein n=1 Tax=Mycolicibacterium aubagnense TaxID=319707 RepID=A0ABN5YNY1_9MYCO|nr:hypothetical protein [Mycolicibacterium aubagnense]TLH60092.1 hypothetical protein C1S80_17420 [Mycolicibacterium aubagnense]WGI34853.1 hypothetical protein QDT91_11165 [Mycolicibacterium aubagnense]BBX83246.1 hypothetical protein MAUB_11190 [Mycolicibacterium aubagnense]